jgi:hypothetical protein
MASVLAVVAARGRRAPMTTRRAVLVGGSLLLAVPGLAALAHAQADLRRFFGTYAGEAIVEGAADLEKRDINAEISPQGKGFTVKWTMVIRKKAEKPRKVEYTITFQPTKRQDLYSSAMRTDVFGNAVPLDPMSGDPYLWARIEGNTFWMYALLVTDEGGYEMQTYERTLTAGGMDLRYSRIRDGEVLRTITGKLKKVK